MWKEYLGELFDADVLSSPLYQPIIDPNTLDISGDHTESNLFLVGSWAEVRKHLKWCLYGKRKAELGFTYRIVTDELLLSVWLGKRAYIQRAKDKRDDGQTFNDLRDLLDSPSLVILKLGVMQSRNKAAVSVLMEALQIRVDSDKPTWIVEGETPFGEGHVFYSNLSHQYIQKHFEVVELQDPSEIKPDEQPSAEAIKQILEAADKGEVTVSMDELPQRTPPPRQFSQEGKFDYRKPGKYSKGKKNSGGTSGLLD
jgi:hypothetical protein